MDVKSQLSSLFKGVQQNYDQGLINKRENPVNPISSKDIESISLEVSQISFSQSNNQTTLQVELFSFSMTSGSVNGIETPNFSLKDIGYEGKPFDELTQDDAKALVAEDGFFGIAQTAERLANFVLNGAGSDIEKLRAGREGIIQGFKEAEAIWGETLPDISYNTLNKALESIDKALIDMGVPVLDAKA
jgi:hypothetical protein